MQESSIVIVKQKFLEALPGFQSFSDPPALLCERELDYKKQAVTQIHALLGEFVADNRQFVSDAEASKTLLDVIDLTNFFNWRTTVYLTEQLFVDDGDWLLFGNMLVDCLRKLESGNWHQSLKKILDWLNEKNCTASMTKILPTYFLFLWDPKHHFCIRSRFVDRFLRQLDEKPLGQGKALTVEEYQRVLDVLDSFREAIADWHPRDNIDVHSLAWVVTGGWSGIAEVDPSQTSTVVEDANSAVAELKLHRPNIPLNLILAGPPGTGKTYSLLNKYVPLFEEGVAEQSLEDFVYEHCAELSWYEVCYLGLKLLGRPANVSDLVETEPVKARAKSRASKKYVTNTLWTSMLYHTPEECPNVNLSSVYRRTDPLLFWKDEEPTWNLLEGVDEMVPHLAELAEEIENYQPVSTVARRYEFVTFHQSYSYEDFIEGIKPVMSAAEEQGEAPTQVSYAVEPGIFTRMVRRAVNDPRHSYALFIDEINRANISSVFGELITLLEPDKRMRFDPETNNWENGIRVKLPYTHATRPLDPLFGIPNNLYVIGTMNTADRSIALLDLALRRRFTFDEIMPDPGLLATGPGPLVSDDGVEVYLDKLLETMNERIEYLYDRDHTIGHSYLMGVKSLDHLEQVFRQKIIPLLQEYFYGDWHKIQLVLGDLTSSEDVDYRPKLHPHAIISHVVQRPRRLFGIEEEAFEDRRSYVINEDLSAESFLKIYKSE